MDFENIFYLIEADSYACHHEGLRLLNRYRDAKHDLTGTPIMVGHIIDKRENGDEFERPIMMTFWKYTIGKLTIAFYDAHSALVDWNMVKGWIKKRYKGPMTDVTNMHHCLHALDDELGINRQDAKILEALAKSVKNTYLADQSDHLLRIARKLKGEA